MIPLLYFRNKINFAFFKELKKPKKISYSIIFPLLTTIRNLCLMNVIYIFNASHISFLVAIVIFDNTIRQFFKNDNIYNFKEVKGIMYFSVDIIALILIIFGSLIFNEMIIINAFGLNEKTKPGLLFLEKIEKFDNLDSSYSEDEDEKDEENKKGVNNQSIQRNQKNDTNQNENNELDEEKEEKSDLKLK